MYDFPLPLYRYARIRTSCEQTHSLCYLYYGPLNDPKFARRKGSHLMTIDATRFRRGQLPVSPYNETYFVRMVIITVAHLVELKTYPKADGINTIEALAPLETTVPLRLVKLNTVDMRHKSRMELIRPNKQFISNVHPLVYIHQLKRNG